MVGRGALTERAWARLAPLLPRNGQPGGPWREHRVVITGLLWRLRTGAPWRDIPERHGPWQTCHDRFVRWPRDGTWDRLVTRRPTRANAVGEADWVVSLDCTIARAHQHAAGARRRPSRADQRGGGHTRPMRRSGAAEAD